MGTYDILRKNENTFSDCALWYLIGKRLTANYRRMEDIGLAGSLAAVRNKAYVQNPRADDFDLDKVMESIDSKKKDDEKAADEKKADEKAADKKASRPAPSHKGEVY